MYPYVGTVAGWASMSCTNAGEPVAHIVVGMSSTGFNVFINGVNAMIPSSIIGTPSIVNTNSAQNLYLSSGYGPITDVQIYGSDVSTSFAYLDTKICSDLKPWGRWFLTDLGTINNGTTQGGSFSPLLASSGYAANGKLWPYVSATSFNTFSSGVFGGSPISVSFLFTVVPVASGLGTNAGGVNFCINSGTVYFCIYTYQVTTSVTGSGTNTQGLCAFATSSATAPTYSYFSGAGVSGASCTTALANLKATAWATTWAANAVGMSTAFSRLTTFNHILMTVNGQGYTVYVNGVAHGGSTSILNGMPLVGTSSGTLSIILPAGSAMGNGGGGVYNDMQLYTADLSVYGVNLYNGGGPSLFCLPPALPTASTPAATSLSWVGGPTNVACSDLIANYRYLGGPGPTVSTSNTGSAGAAAATSTATWDSVNYGVGITTTSASFLSPAISFTSNVAGIGFWLRHSSATLQPMVTLGGGLRMWAGAYGACITNATGSTSSSTSCTGLQSYAYTLTGFPMRYSSNNVWNHFLFTATSGNVFTLFINGVVAGRSTTGAYSTYFTGSTTVGFAAPGYSSGNIVVFADLQIYNANDLSTAGGNLYNSYACNSPTSQNITMTAATPVSMYSSSPYAAGPPFENSCPDTQPWHRIVGNSSSYATTASDLVNTGSCTTPATASGVAWSSTYGGLLINGSTQTLALPPTLFVNQGAVTIAAWINHNVGATWTPALVIGNGLYLYVSSTYGVCVTSGSVLASGTNACNTYWSYSLANTPVRFVCTWCPNCLSKLNTHFTH